MAITQARQGSHRSSQPTEEELPTAVGTAPEFGVAHFDLQDVTSGGICYSTNGGFRRFQSGGDLMNLIWVTNLDMVPKQLPSLRSNKFLQTKLTTLAEDLGVELTGFKQVNGVDKGGMVDVARVLNHTRDLVVAAYPWKAPDREWNKPRLSECIAELLPSVERSVPQIEVALRGAYQSWSSPQMQQKMMYDRGSRMIYFRRNRVEHALDIMRTPLPTSGWYKQPFLDLDNLLDAGQPTLVEVAIEWRNADADTVSLIAFGADAGNTPHIRRWVSQIELTWLLKYARISVLSAYQANAAAPLPAQLQLPSVIAGDPIYQLSIPHGLVAEAHWAGLARPQYNRMKRQSEVTTTSVWYRAMDRAISFQMALAAKELGGNVTGYGSGGVQVRMENLSVQQLLEVADAVGASHPCLASEVVGRERGDS
ncbi:hypothetical protein [Variovorax ginsengisoli]|uniref:Uncharacterized protein n=1 Tax=Variovorax ginsengisoli TaxID=363844 RepID=A0ABT8S9R2_9BURK|nr:hypothetical protein [Variovorax ginsengisoli]MDN8616476.1 hypothetical protein [Variovorax ginsengisoli]MDO1535646.1 hypothetical protein [Variovorax ginsengisoli]